MPDKAIDVIDEAELPSSAAAKSTQEEHWGYRCGAGGREDCADSLQSSHRLDKASLRLDTNLKMAVFGQNEAIEQLATAIKLSRAG